MEYIETSDENILESKLQEIIKQSQMENNQEARYYEIISEGGRVSTRLIDPSELNENGEPKIVQADQIVGLDLVNYRVISCDEDDVAQEIITDDGEVDIVEGQSQYILQHSENDTENKKITVTDYSTSETKGAQFMHIVEQDSVPLVIFSDKPNHPLNQQKEIKKMPIKRKKGDIILSELISSPKFKPYLYNCKLCDFKCNAIKELSAHRLKEHTSNGITPKYRNIRPPTSTQPTVITPEPIGGEIRFGVNMSYCSVCSYSSISSQQVMKHILKVHGFIVEEKKGNRKSVPGKST